MKKIYHYENLSGAGLVTGRAVRIVRDSDGLEIDCTEIGTTGKYLAEIATPSGYGIYSVFDVTSGSPGIDLDQKVDVFSSQTIAEQITFPGDPAKFLDGNEVFRVPGILDVSGLSTALAGKEPTIAAGGNSRHVWFGDKTFRAIASEDLPDNSLKRVSFNTYCVAKELGTLSGDLVGSIDITIIELIYGLSYIVMAKPNLPDPLSAINLKSIMISATVSYTSGDLKHRFINAVKGKLVLAGDMMISSASTSFYRTKRISTLWVTADASTEILSFKGDTWETDDLINGVLIKGVVNG